MKVVGVVFVTVDDGMVVFVRVTAIETDLSDVFPARSYAWMV